MAFVVSVSRPVARWSAARLLQAQKAQLPSLAGSSLHSLGAMRRCASRRGQRVVYASAGRDIERSALNALPLFNQLVVHNGTVYISGQVTADATKQTTVADQTKSVLDKIDNLLASVNIDKSRILSASIWLSDISTVAEMNKEWEQWLDVQNKPVRATVEAKLVRPELLVEIQVTAALPPRRSEIVATDLAAAAVGPYNQGIRTADGMLFISGCIGLSPKTGDFAGTTIEEQTKQVLANLDAILKAGGAKGPEQIIKTTILLDDMADFATVNTLYSEYFKGSRVPARACFAAKTLPKNALVEIEAIAEV
ncbi:Reactive Intermediate Deaminase A, chloroplastic [Porphyridium purpureum]|uniref:Reactive Intermediate Deaminase A, chloroplastic n=1 Tax=Porphyridium purpureum TaxID=35688 RepID=A0A5J4Z3P0_PORPP|nr:Reactive Intermediate Deaminase A, chloroplastic [Porphyridium purpureum]|eukprot:POR6426..scf295_1